MAEKELAVCDECGSLFFNGLYGYPSCPHRFLNGRCVNCYWDGSKSEYIKHLEED